MKKNWLIAGAMMLAGLTVGLGLFLESAQADPQQGAGQTRPFIHVINVNEVFKGYSKYQQLTTTFKSEVEKRESQLKAQEQILRAKMEEMKFKKDKSDRDRLEKEIADKRFETEQLKRNFQDELTQKEADIYATVYKDMSDMLTQYCDQYQVPMVLRLQGGADSANPPAVLQSLQRIVVYSNPNLDLTKVITDGLNERLQLAASKPAKNAQE